MYTVIEDDGVIVIKEKYSLKGGAICEQVTHYRKKDDGNIAKLIVLEHDQKQIGAAEMNELIQNGALCFDQPSELEAWRDKNGKVEYDENGVPIKPTKSIVDTLINLIGI